jgi:2-methylcitrate dehydratase PrpD
LLLQLDAAAIKKALLISTSMACGIGANTGSSVQSFHAGWAAENGLLAARLATCAGMSASDVAFDGKEIGKALRPA